MKILRHLIFAGLLGILGCGEGRSVDEMAKDAGFYASAHHKKLASSLVPYEGKISGEKVRLELHFSGQLSMDVGTCLEVSKLDGSILAFYDEFQDGTVESVKIMTGRGTWNYKEVNYDYDSMSSEQSREVNESYWRYLDAINEERESRLNKSLRK